MRTASRLDHDQRSSSLRSHLGIARSTLPILAIGCAASLCHAQPANDACSNATPLAAGTVTGTTAGSANDGSCSCGSAASSPDIWYRFTAAATGTATITTCNLGTSYD